MRDVIEPAQTMWTQAGTDRSVLNCSLRCPPETQILDIALDHVLIRYRQRELFGALENTTDFATMQLVAVRLGCPFDSVVLERARYVGVMKFGPCQDSYVVFLNGDERIEILIHGADPERIAKIFLEEVLKASANRTPVG